MTKSTRLHRTLSSLLAAALALGSAAPSYDRDGQAPAAGNGAASTSRSYALKQTQTEQSAGLAELKEKLRQVARAVGIPLPGSPVSPVPALTAGLEDEQSKTGIPKGYVQEIGVDFFPLNKSKSLGLGRASGRDSVRRHLQRYLSGVPSGEFNAIGFFDPRNPDEIRSQIIWWHRKDGKGLTAEVISSAAEFLRSTYGDDDQVRSWQVDRWGYSSSGKTGTMIVISPKEFSSAAGLPAAPSDSAAQAGLEEGWRVRPSDQHPFPLHRLADAQAELNRLAIAAAEPKSGERFSLVPLAEKLRQIFSGRGLLNNNERILSDEVQRLAKAYNTGGDLARVKLLHDLTDYLGGAEIVPEPAQGVDDFASPAFVIEPGPDDDDLTGVPAAGMEETWDRANANRWQILRGRKIGQALMDRLVKQDPQPEIAYLGNFYWTKGAVSTLTPPMALNVLNGSPDRHLVAISDKGKVALIRQGELESAGADATAWYAGMAARTADGVLTPQHRQLVGLPAEPEESVDVVSFPEQKAAGLEEGEAAVALVEETRDGLLSLEPSDVELGEAHIFDPENADVGRLVSTVIGPDPVVIIARDSEHEEALLASGFGGVGRFIVRLDLYPGGIVEARAAAAKHFSAFSPRFYRVDQRNNLWGWLKGILERYKLSEEILSVNRALRMVESLRALRRSA